MNLLLDGTSVLDQPIPKPLVITEGVAQTKYEEDYVLELADKVLGESLEDGSFELAWMALGKFRAMNKASSLGACKLLYGVNRNWNSISHLEDETFIQEAMRRTGYSQLTIERYISVWEMLTGNYIPEEFKENIQAQTMRQLVKEAETIVEQEYELDHDDWLALSEAIDYERTMEICQAAKGKERNTNHLCLKVDSYGNLSAFQGNLERQVGRLYVNEKDPIIQKAIKRICKNSGITKKNDY